MTILSINNYLRKKYKFINAAKMEKQNRLYNIKKWFEKNPDATNEEAITFIPETKYMVEEFKKTRGLTIEP